MVNRKVIQLDDRIPKLNERRRQRANRRFIFYVVAFFLLLAVVAYLVSPVSNVHSISVIGNHHIETSVIEKAGQISTNSKIWDIDEAKSSALIEKIPMVKKAAVSSHFPNKVVIKVAEYRRVAYLKNNNTYTPILENGTNLTEEKGGILPTDAPIIIGFTEGEKLERLAGQLTKISPAMVHSISEIMPARDKNQSDYIVLYMNSGQQVLADIDTLAKKIKLYPSIMAYLEKGKKGKGIIDLTLGASWTPYEKASKEDVPSGKK
jgi:cell division protein FtsQ